MELLNDYITTDSGLVVTEKVKIKGSEDELRELALTILEAIDDGKSRGYIDGVPLRVKLIR